MKINMNRFVNVVVITAVLLLNVACASSQNANVWSDADYGAGTFSAPKSFKTANGITILN